MDPKSIGKLVREHRRKAGLSQKGLADLTGIGKSSVFNVEKGKESIHLGILLKILATLNIEVTLESPLLNTERNQK